MSSAPGVQSDDAILEMIRRDEALDELLRQSYEFDLSRSDHGEAVRLSSGEALQGIAGDFSGGTYFLCGPNRATRPVLYASSEGQAGLIGDSLTEALEIMIGLPSWLDCLGFSGGGDLAVMSSTAEHLRNDELRDHPEADSLRTRAAQALSLQLRPVPELLARLRAAVAGTPPGFLLSEDGEEHDSLFGQWLPSRNPAWS